MEPGQKWIVTGNAGFLGSHVVEQLLAKGQKVLGIDNMGWGSQANIDIHSGSDAFEFVKADIRDTEKMVQVFNDYKPDRVIHLAALHFIPDAIKNPAEAVSINLHGTQSVLQAARCGGVKSLWFASTGDVYEPSEEPHHEENSIKKPFNIYGMTKFLGEQLIDLESKQNEETKFIVGRLFNLVGTRETNPHILPVIFDQLREHPGKLQLGNIFPLRDFVPISDAASALIEMNVQARAKIEYCNVATGSACSVENIIELIGDILGQKIEVEIDQSRVRKAERNVLSSDVSRLKDWIGWTPNQDLRAELTALLMHEGLLNQKSA